MFRAVAVFPNSHNWLLDKFKRHLWLLRQTFGKALHAFIVNSKNKKNTSLNRIYYIIVLVLIFSVPTAFGFTQENLDYDDESRIFGDWKPIEVEEGAISWKVFGKTKEIEGCVFNEKEGYDDCITRPEYSEEVKNLDSKQVKLMGYMFPLENSEELTNFLIIPYPLSCPFHAHSGPAQTIEVLTKEPIKFSFDPVTIEGKFSVDFNEETGTFYYLNDAVKG